MSRLADRFSALAARGEGAFMPFTVLGDPSPEVSLEICRALLRGGADLLELGFAFSDPPADGPVIQAADQRALAAGITPSASFALLERLRRETDVPFTLLIYYNLVLRIGLERFYRRCREVGVEAVLVADLPIEESADAAAAAREQEVAPVQVISERTSDPRLAKIAAVAGGYLYVVAHLGVTGARDAIGPGLAPTIARARAATSLPLLAGFGLSSPEQVRAALAAGADGAIVGSALVQEIELNLGAAGAMLSAVEAKARALKAATRSQIER